MKETERIIPVVDSSNFSNKLNQLIRNFTDECIYSYMHFSLIKNKVEGRAWYLIYKNTREQPKQTLQFQASIKNVNL